MSVAAAGVIPLKTGAGESDFQARGIAFNNYTFLKEAEKRENFRSPLVADGEKGAPGLFPNMNVKDDVWRKLMRDVRFRRALSLAINGTK